MMLSSSSSMHSTTTLLLRVKLLLQTMDQRQHHHLRRTKSFVIQIMLLLAASFIYYRKTFYAEQTTQPKSSIASTNTSAISSLGEQKVINPPRHWTLNVHGKGNRLDCRISTTPVLVSSSSSMALTEQYTIDNNKEQYVVNIHGLHHSGTGYLRQTLHDALNEAFSNMRDNNITVASMQDSLRPYQQLLDEAGEDTEKRKKILKRFHKPEDEGQHLQSIYPNFATRYTRMKKAKGPSNKKFNRLSYIADLCHVVDGETNSNNATSLESDDTLPDNIDKHKVLGKELFQQWSRYWDTSATFLLQKSPMLDLLFLEKTKILPTLHVIVVRHPMTSNSWGTSYMSHLWLSSWLHTFQALADQKIEWYAVVTYEALISFHDEVVDELLEVVRSGMRRFQNSQSQRLVMAASAVNGEHGAVSEINDSDTRHRSSHRRLELHRNKNATQSSTNPYLVPKPRSIKYWKKCLNQTKCNQILTRLTKGIFPHLGYENNNGRPLRKTPGIVTVREEYGRVLFTSEGVALNKLRRSSLDDSLKSGAGKEYHIDYVPTFELISKMKEALK